MYWKRIKEEIQLPVEIEKYNRDIFNENSFDFINYMKEEPKAKYSNYLTVNGKNGLGEEFLRLSENSSNTGFIIDIDSNCSQNKSKIDFFIDKENPTIVSHNLIICRENSSLELTINYDDSGEINGFNSGFTKIYVEKGAKLTCCASKTY